MFAFGKYSFHALIEAPGVPNLPILHGILILLVPNPNSKKLISLVLRLLNNLE